MTQLSSLKATSDFSVGCGTFSFHHCYHILLMFAIDSYQCNKPLLTSFVYYSLRYWVGADKRRKTVIWHPYWDSYFCSYPVFNTYAFLTLVNVPPCPWFLQNLDLPLSALHMQPTAKPCQKFLHRASLPLPLSQSWSHFPLLTLLM